MSTAKRYRLVAADPYREFVLTATGGDGQRGHPGVRGRVRSRPR